MANTKIPVELSSTPGIVDNSNATAITIDSNENVGIGTSSPNASFKATLSGLYGLRIQSGDTNNSALNIGSDTGSGYAFIDSTKTGTGTFLPLRFSTSDLERLRIDTSGNVGIGTSSPTQALAVESSSVGVTRVSITNTGNAAAGAGVQFVTKNGATQVSNATVRTDNAGNFSVFTGTTSDGERMRISSTGAFYLYGIIGFGGANSDVRYDTSTGQIYYQTSSQRYKSEITDLEDSLDKIKSLRPVRFKDNQTEKFTTGLIAEEVIDIIPEVVFKKDIDGFDEPQPEGINYSDITPFLTKAIQEQQTIIEDLQARIETLENA